MDVFNALLARGGMPAGWYIDGHVFEEEEDRRGGLR